jgi:sugar phosphate isomerase/epimerase
MKLSCQATMFGDVPLPDRFQLAHAAGFEGIDLFGDQLEPVVDTARELSARTGVEIPTVYGRLRIPLVGARAAERLQAMDILRERLALAARVGARRLIVVPIFGDPRFELDWPGGVEQAELALLAVQLKELAVTAEACRVRIVLEPLNRKETHLLRSPCAAAEFTRRIASEWIATMADTYHMDLEQQDLAQQVRLAADQLHLVHISDRDRKLPGRGGIDFAPLIAALQDIGYIGYLGYECRGAFDLQALRESVRYVRGLL